MVGAPRPRPAEPPDIGARPLGARRETSAEEVDAPAAINPGCDMGETGPAEGKTEFQYPPMEGMLFVAGAQVWLRCRSEAELCASRMTRTVRWLLFHPAT